MILETIPQLKNLNSEQKLILAAELRNDVDGTAIDLDSDPAIFDLVKDLYDDYLANPDKVKSWNEIKTKRSIDSDA